MSTDNSTPTPLASTAMEAAREIRNHNIVTGTFICAEKINAEIGRIRGYPNTQYVPLQVTAEIIAQHFQPLLAKVEGERDAWIESARQFSNSATFYHDIVTKIGELFGVAAKTSDDGSIQQDVLALKVPELVAALRADLAAKEAALERYRETAANINRLWMNAKLTADATNMAEVAGQIANLKAVGMLLDDALASRADKGGAR